MAIVVAELFYRRGMPQKWEAAIFGTLLPFWVALVSNQLRWSRWSFWASLAICLAIHLLGIWIFFQYILMDVRHLGLALWFPVAFVEVFILLFAVQKVEQKIIGG
jgi:hypothetical protein